MKPSPQADNNSGALGPVLETREFELHGHPASCKIAGSGPPLYAVPGITGETRGWEDAILELARNHTVVSPDLFGFETGLQRHDGDYSLRGHEMAIRDLMIALGHDRVTFFGHSLGGGICTDFAFNHPHRVERLILVSSGGFGREVNPLFALAGVPGIGTMMAAVRSTPLPRVLRGGSQLLSKLGQEPSTDLKEIARGLELGMRSGSRDVFIDSIRSVINHHGQRININNLLYLLEKIPTMLVWGDQDPVIPVAHGREAHRLIPNSRLEILEGIGHFPYVDCRERLMELTENFISSTEPAALTQEEFVEAVRKRSGAVARPD